MIKATGAEPIDRMEQYYLCIDGDGFSTTVHSEAITHVDETGHRVTVGLQRKTLITKKV